MIVTRPSLRHAIISTELFTIDTFLINEVGMELVVKMANTMTLSLHVFYKIHLILIIILMI